MEIEGLAKKDSHLSFVFCFLLTRYFWRNRTNKHKAVNKEYGRIWVVQTQASQNRANLTAINLAHSAWIIILFLQDLDWSIFSFPIQSTIQNSPELRKWRTTEERKWSNLKTMKNHNLLLIIILPVDDLQKMELFFALNCWSSFISEHNLYMHP